MRRRDKALIAILLPIVLVTLLSYIHPVSYNILMGYMLAVVLVFKSSLLSLWFISKLKIVAFIKGLTLVQALLLGIKRWFIDNMLSRWLEKYIFSHLKKPLSELLQYYRAVSFRAKLKNFFIIVFPLGVGLWLMYLSDLLSHIALFVELKVIVIGFFKTLWVIFAKIFAVVPMILGWISGSWFAPILEVFALSYLLSLIEKLLGTNNPITKFFNYIGDRLNDFLSYLGLLNDKHIEPILNNTISKGSRTFADKISSMIRNKKIKEEYLYFDNFRNIILKGHINAYHSFAGMEDIHDKTKLYTMINEQTKDNIDIIAYVSRNGKGEILQEQYQNNYYHDIFILKGIASNQNHGVKEYLDTKIDHSDFWVLNSSRLPVWIKSNSDNIEPKLLKGNEVRLVKTKKQTAFDTKDIYFEHEGVIVYPTEITSN